MTPEERQLISGLFERMRPAANQQRDRQAEALINDELRAQPYAPYLLAQTVIVQEQALRAASDKIQDLEAQLRQPQNAPQEETSFLGGIGKSIFGGGSQPRQSVPSSGNYAPPQQPGAWGNPNTQGGNPGAGGPWGGGGSSWGGMAGAAANATQGGGFLKGALGAAAGVAGGVLLADGIRNLFSGGHNPYGIASGLGGMEGFGNPGGETVINNFYENAEPAPDAAGLGAADFGGGSDFDPGFGGGNDPDTYDDV